MGIPDLRIDGQPCGELRAFAVDRDTAHDRRRSVPEERIAFDIEEDAECVLCFCHFWNLFLSCFMSIVSRTGFFIPILLTDGYGLVTCKPADLQQEAVIQDTIR